MIVGLLSDAHGNVEGFRLGIRLLRRMGAVHIFFLGDAVGYLPGAGVVDAIATEGVEPIAGNHEAMLLSAESARDDTFRLREARQELGTAGLRLVASWPTQKVLETRAGSALLVHDSPFGAHKYIYPDTDLREFGTLPWAFVCMGHTHRAFVRQEGATTFVNVGSCGLPRDDGRLGAVATLDTEKAEPRIVRYDLSGANERALARVGPVHRLVTSSMARRGEPHRSARTQVSMHAVGESDV